ncbi:MAG: hypothetical protein V7K67_01645 [Nostoc sp.]|uniref:hypothetical protein n=1 Tax=Nostoc sp. TaxID=1180 RepID=UPI002FF79B9D
MYAQTAELKTNLEPQVIQGFNGLSSREVMNQLLSIGYQTILLKGALVDQFSDGISLWVEEDAKFLIDDYFYLEKLLTSQKPYEHGSFLNDGLLSFTATSDRTRVEIEFRYCPGLDIANLVTHHLTITENEYVWWWRNIAHQILNLVSST